MCRFLFSLILAVAAIAAGASKPFIGTLRNTKGLPVKGVKVFLHTPKDAVKSDKKGEFRFEDVDSTDFIHIDYKGREYAFAARGKQDMMFVVGEDNRIFERDSYTGETFHGHLIDYKGKPIRGAVVYGSDPFDYVKSDRDGNFLLDNVEPTDTLHIKHDGYIHDIAMDGSKGMYIKILNAHGRRADRDLVNTGAGMMDARDYNGPRAVRTAKELEAMGTADLVLAMMGMKGVQVSRANGTGESSVSVRGGKPLWVIDGVRLDKMPDLTVMEVERVEVLHDGGMYGIGGFGGVINVTTKGTNF